MVPCAIRGENLITGISAVGSAPALGAGCREFESPISDQEYDLLIQQIVFSFGAPVYVHSMFSCN